MITLLEDIQRKVRAARQITDGISAETVTTTNEYQNIAAASIWRDIARDLEELAAKARENSQSHCNEAFRVRTTRQAQKRGDNNQ